MAVLQTQLSHLIALHVRSRAFPTLDDAAQFIKGVIALYDVYVESQNLWASQAAAKAAAAVTSAAAAQADSQVSNLAHAAMHALRHQVAVDNAHACLG